MTVVEFQKELSKLGISVTGVNHILGEKKIEFSYTKGGKSLTKEVNEKELGPELARKF